jgi:hypothetical protein
VSVDTNTTDKNLSPYTRVRHPEFRILVSPVLSGMVSRMKVTTRGRFVKQLHVELADDPHRPVYAAGDDS